MQTSSNDDPPSTWTDEDWIDTLSDPFHIGLDTFAPIVSVDAFARAVIEVMKFIGVRSYLKRCYDKIVGHVGVVPGLGTCEEFVERQVEQIIEAPSEIEAVQAILSELQRLLPPRAPTPLVYIVDVETTPDIMQALTYDDVDEALEICEIICCICGGAFWEERSDGKYVVKAPDDTYLCAMITGDPDAEDDADFEEDADEDEGTEDEEPEALPN